MSQTLFVRARTLALALLGVLSFQWLQLPLPFLFGPMTALLLAALCGLQLKGAGVVSNASRAILGVAIGASITPALLHQLPSMAITVSLVPVYVALCGLIGVPYFKRVCRFDSATAYYAAMPGGLQDMVLFGQEAGGNARTISLIQATRLLIFVTIAPFALSHLYGLNLYKPVGIAARDLPLEQLLVMVVLALVGWWAGVKVKMFGAPMLGPMVIASVASLAGILHERPPREAILFAQVFVGLGIGVYYTGLTVQELRRDIVSGMGYVLMLLLLSTLFVFGLSHFHLGDPVSIFLAYAPAGQAEMAVLALVVGADLGYVVAHHIVRVVLVIVGAPLAGAYLQRESGKRKARKPGQSGESD